MTEETIRHACNHGLDARDLGGEGSFGLEVCRGQDKFLRGSKVIGGFLMEVFNFASETEQFCAWFVVTYCAREQAFRYCSG